MMRILIFELRSEIAHFRRPDTMGTQATYPFITRTALRGLVASILGLKILPTDVRCGVRLLSPVRTIVQELNMHGKTWVSPGEEKSFRRPTAIELVVKPHYKIYYSGSYIAELSQRIKNRQSHYHTYLGSAYCLTFPQWIADQASINLLQMNGEAISCFSIVPSLAVQKLIPTPEKEYARVGGVLMEALGNMDERRFRGTLSLLYEVNGSPLTFIPNTNISDSFWQFCKIDPEGVVCLW